MTIPIKMMQRVIVIIFVFLLFIIGSIFINRYWDSIHQEIILRQYNKENIRLIVKKTSYFLATNKKEKLILQDP